MKLLAFETHPIQYRAPIFKQYESMYPGELEVVYASDFSIKGYKDKGFGTQLSWDVPLLAGYSHTVLNLLRQPGTEYWNGIVGTGIGELIRDRKPDVIFMSSVTYLYNWAVLWHARRLGIPVVLRVETQDSAFQRGPLKGLLRRLVYRFIYRQIAGALYIGQLNKQHLMAHGVSEDKLMPAHYCTENAFENVSDRDFEAIRLKTRRGIGVPDDHRVISFFGKLIDKKNPNLILKSLQKLPSGRADNTTCLIVGAGPIEAEVKIHAEQLQKANGICTIFLGFINQTQIQQFYAASDIVILPSQRMGETWGLVANEALHAGCSVIVSDAVGCSSDFKALLRFRVIESNNADQLLQAIQDLWALPREYRWAAETMEHYSIRGAAIGVHKLAYQLHSLRKV